VGASVQKYTYVVKAQVSRLLSFLVLVRETSQFFAELLMEQGSVKRSGRGRPRLRPLRLVGDKGYTGRKARRTESSVRQTLRRIRNYLRRRGIRLTIPRLSNEPRRGPKAFEIYRQRNEGVERAINRLKQFRRIATRYEKLATNYTAMPSDRLHSVVVIV
jgi:transposase